MPDGAASGDGKLRRPLHHLRAAAARGAARPAYVAGLRAAVATMVPVILGSHLPADAATWMSLAGFNGALNDRGGSYRSRASTMIAVTVFGAIGVALGALAHGRLRAAVAVTFAVALLCAIARVWGSAGVGVGGAVLSSFLISVAAPPGGVHDAAMRAGFALLGGAWAMLISLVLWPLRPYRPVRVAVAACYRAVAAFAEDLAARAGRVASHDAWDLRGATMAVRATLEEARGVLASTRLGRPGESERGERLLVVHETAEQTFVHLLALTDTIESIADSGRDPAVEVVLAATLHDVAGAARRIAEAVLAERDSPRVAIGWSGEGLRTATRGSDIHYEHAARLLDRAAQYADVGAATAESLNGGGEVKLADAVLQPGGVEQPPRLGERLRELLAPGPLIVRHALRVATLTAFAVWLAAVLGLRRDYWVTITVVIILQPYSGATTQRALQRVIGTVVGAMLTAALAAAFHSQYALLAMIFVFVALCVALLPVNYAAYSIFLTPAFVLLAEASAGDWHLAGVRVTNTLIGGAIALVGSWLLWPSSEWRDFPALAAAALRATRVYLRLAALSATGDADAAASLGAARRAVAVAAANVEESFQRLLAEHRGPAVALQPAMTLQTYIRRFAVSAGALALTGTGADHPARDALAPFTTAATAVLDDLADAVRESRRPAEFPVPGSITLFATAVAPVVRARVERLARQLKSLHDAVAEISVVRPGVGL
ncbi:MAG TPA: FUSC family protein [Gemmatimonadaceae bacterium]|nr:FUSC family protein [Gemmatimonadaceae bacterium]